MARDTSPTDPSPTGPRRWLDEHGDAMYRYAMLRLADPDAAADAVQEALVAAIRARETFRGASQERTWLIGILRHKVLDAIRKRRRNPAALPQDDPAETPRFKDGTFREEPAAWSALPSSPEEAKELRKLLARCLAELPDTMRQALCLREIDGLATPEICKILDITPTNLWTLVHRAKLRLRDDLSRHWFGEDG